MWCPFAPKNSVMKVGSELDWSVYQLRAFLDRDRYINPYIQYVLDTTHILKYELKTSPYPPYVLGTQIACHDGLKANPYPLFF